ncbi:MAG TPA: flippase [Ktedonobacterales bacterium]|nr:flippase [Ktedonobacterales bacterium]
MRESRAPGRPARSAWPVDERHEWAGSAPSIPPVPPVPLVPPGPGPRRQPSRSTGGRLAAIPGQITGTIKAVGNSTAVVVAQLINRAAMYIAFLLASLTLPLYDFGLYTLVLALKEILNSVATFGLDQVLIRLLARADSMEARKRLLRDAVVLKLLCSAIAGAVLLDGMLWLRVSNDLVLGSAIMLADLILANLSSSLMSYYQARLLSSTPTMLQAVARALDLAGMVAGMLTGASWLVLLEILLLSDALLCVLLTVKLGRHLGAVVAIPLPYRTQMFFEAIPLGIASIGVLLYTRIDTMLIANLRNVSEVAYYSAAYKLTESPLVIMTGISATVLPLISSLAMSPDIRQRIAAIAQRSLRYTYTLSLIAAVAVTFFGRQMVAVIYEGRYTQIAPAVVILIWGTVAMASNSVTASIYTAMKRQRLLMVVVGVNLVVNLAVNLWAIPRWGYFGSAVATTATEGVNMLVQVVILCWLLGQARLAFTTALALIVGGASITLYFLMDGRPSPLLGAEALGALVIILLLCRMVTRDDIQRMRGAARRILSRRRRLAPYGSAR